MKRAHPQAGVEFELSGGVPGLSPDEASSIAQLTKSLLRPRPSAKVSYGTEAGFFQQAGIPSIVCGPGSIEHAHKPDEFVPLAQLAECEQFMHRLVGRLSVPANAPAAV